uniref:H15 domain-containing protein n=1 Tax=Clastoptera arizonana TaxID=38151 RepID=A0A1B6CN64_9HEMI
MADTAANAAAPAASPKKGKAAAAAAAASKKPRVKPAHPPTSDMVNAAIKSLKERGGSSLQAIKKYIAANYKVDAEKMAPFIKKYLKAAVASGALVQPKGKGASGSFKLSGEGKTTAVKKVPAKTPKEKKAAATKAAAPKKKTAATSKKPAAAEKKKAAAAAVAVKTKTPSKAKKTAQPPTKKPKSPKPKKAAVKKAKTPKKAAPNKK